MDAFDLDISKKYMRWVINNQSKGKPAPVATLMRRTMNTATMVLSTIKDIPFTLITSSLYLFCSDVKVISFTRLYESQLELAGANPDAFARGLHKFYMDMSHKIKADNLYQDFFEFISLCSALRHKHLLLRPDDKDPESESMKVLNCYFSLLLQNTEYLRPDKFNFSTVLCGMKTTGELMARPDIFPTLDAPGFEMEQLVISHQFTSQLEVVANIQRIYHKHGFMEVNALEDIDRLSNIDRIYGNTVAAMLPFTNEYTYDILPVEPFTTLSLPFYALNVSTPITELEEMLRHRCRTLPTNGAQVRIAPPEAAIVEQVHFKECVKGDSLFMLYRAETCCGDLSGYYNTATGVFHTAFADAQDNELYDRFKAFILYLYACNVTRGGDSLLQKMPQDCWVAPNENAAQTPLYAEIFGRGGPLRNVFDKGGLAPDEHHARKGNEKYAEELRTIQGFVRRVGKGRTPSAEAVAKAKALGFDLEPDETYVQPFIRSVLKLKMK